MSEAGTQLMRIADALEKLASDPEVEIHAGPPVCPNCGTYDPTIVVQEFSGVGKLSEFLIVGICESCSTKIYGVVESYSMHVDKDAAVTEISSEARREMFNGQPIA